MNQKFAAHGGVAEVEIAERIGRRVDDLLERPAAVYLRVTHEFMPQKLFVKSFCRSQLPYKSVNSSFIITNMKKRLTNLCGN